MNEAAPHYAHRRVAVVVPCRNEADLLPGLLDSLVAQTLTPVRLVVVDDGSTDDTNKIAEDYAARHDWIRVIARKDRGSRKLGGGVVDAFNEGLAAVDVEWDYVAKVDADLTFGPRYIEAALGHFEADPKLGSLSGKVYRKEPHGLVEEFLIDEMVAGCWKLYRKACFQAIDGLHPALMWDGIDFHRARMAGFRTASVYDEDMKITHHRLMGSTDRGIVRGRLRWGTGQWYLGTHPLYMISAAAWRMKEKPYVVGGLLILLGYLRSCLKGEKRYQYPGFRQSLHTWQFARLKRLFTRGAVR